MLVFVCITAFSAIHTVDNKPKSSADFTALQEAINTASAGDTIYIMGSTSNYGNITITKQLALIGAGYRVDNQWGFPTTIGHITFKQGLDEFNNPISDPSGSYLSGVNVNWVYAYAGENLLIERCKTQYVEARTSVSIEVRNCITYGIYSGNYIMEATIQNSIIIYGLYSYNASSSLIVDHCLFLDRKVENSNLQFAIITNSIMYSVSTENITYTTFSNNISIGGTFTDFIYGTNTGGGNMKDTNPQFMTIDGVTFSFSDDFRLQVGSPAIGAASDGTDIGIYGGSFPFPVGGEGTYLMAAPPTIPQITEVNILNAAVPEGGTLQVNIKAKNQE